MLIAFRIIQNRQVANLFYFILLTDAMYCQIFCYCMY